MAVIAIGAHQRGLASILHDASHQNLFKSRRLGHIAGRLCCAWPLLIQFDNYYQAHVRSHHPELGKVTTDPDLKYFATKKIFEPTTRMKYLARVLIWPVLGGQTLEFLWVFFRKRILVLSRCFNALTHRRLNSIASRSNFRKVSKTLGLTGFWATVLVVSFLGILPIRYVALFWLIPYISTFLVIGWFIDLAAHCTSTEGRNTDIFMTRNRRSRHLEKWLTGINGDDYHLVHHLFPRVPFWKLRHAHQICLNDATYADYCARTGGLFQKGPNGEISVMGLLLLQNFIRLHSKARDVYF